MRLYTFINYYLSSIQQGIQSAHIVHELFNKYEVDSSETPLMLRDWSRNHKTIITLNGGNNESLSEFYRFLEVASTYNGNRYPFVKFHEDTQSLNETMTGFGVVLPAKVYDAAEAARSRKAYFGQNTQGDWRLYKPTTITGQGILFDDVEYSLFEVELIKRMNECPLAR